jgi:chaperonin cofactor prefoldin
VEERHSSGVISTETYTEQAEKLDKRITSLESRLKKKKKELEKITAE